MTIQYFGPTPAMSPPSAVVMVDLPCLKCRSNLRGMQFTQRCAQCGTPVGRTVEGDLLRYAEPTSVATIQRGLKWLLAAMLSLVGISILGGVVGAIIGAFNAASTPRADPVALQKRMAGSVFVSAILAHAAAIVVALVAAQGVRILTRSSLRADPTPPGRIGPYAIALAWAAGLLVSTITFTASGVTAAYRPPLFQALVALVNALLQATMLFLLLPYVRSLSVRLGANEVGKLLRIAMVGQAICAIAAAAIHIVVVKFGPSPEEQIRNPFGSPVLTCSAALPGLAMLLAMVLLMVGLFQMFGRVREAHRQASLIYAQGHLVPPIPVVSASQASIDVNGLDRPA